MGVSFLFFGCSKSDFFRASISLRFPITCWRPLFCFVFLSFSLPIGFRGEKYLGLGCLILRDNHRGESSVRRPSPKGRGTRAASRLTSANQHVNHPESTSLVDVADGTRWEGRSTTRCFGRANKRWGLNSRTLWLNLGLERAAHAPALPPSGATQGPRTQVSKEAPGGRP